MSERRKRFAGLHVVERDSLRNQIIKPVHKIIASYDTDLDAALKIVLPHYIHDCRAASFGIYAARIRNNLYVAIDACR